MAVDLEITPEVEQRLRAIARDEMERWRQGVQEDWSPEKMRAAMRRIVERRQRISMTPEEVEQLIEEHRREIGRGPLVDEDADQLSHDPACDPPAAA